MLPQRRIASRHFDVTSALLASPTLTASYPTSHQLQVITYEAAEWEDVEILFGSIWEQPAPRPFRLQGASMPCIRALQGACRIADNYDSWLGVCRAHIAACHTILVLARLLGVRRQSTKVQKCFGAIVMSHSSAVVAAVYSSTLAISEGHFTLSIPNSDWWHCGPQLGRGLAQDRLRGSKLRQE